MEFQDKLSALSEQYFSVRLNFCASTIMMLTVEGTQRAYEWEVRTKVFLKEINQKKDKDTTK